jgi:hypothetical protein
MSHGRHVLRAAVLCAVLGVLVTVIACWETPSLILPLSILGVSSFVGVGIKHANAHYDPDSLVYRRVERLVSVCSLIALLSSVGILVWMLIEYQQFKQLGD